MSHPGAIEVSAENGIVTLRGDLLRSEVRHLMRRAYSIRDVADIRNELRVCADEKGIPALAELRRSPGIRLALGPVGGALVIYAATNRQTIGKVFM